MHIFFDGQKIKMNLIKLQKMAFIYRSIESGWVVKKEKDCYIFSKRHKDDKKILLDSYLKGFVMSNLDIKEIFK